MRKNKTKNVNFKIKKKMQEKNFIKKSNGITLIALIVIIIVLLILARNKYICHNWWRGSNR
ncbi:MAG: hypothetical protein IKF38_06665 [Clostridia bacterium]|nr:hypothetical protein [Clostridia bacterium]